MTTIDLERAEVVPHLPTWFDSWRGRPMPDGLVGAEIMFIGTFADRKALGGGGLVIDYRPRGEQDSRRVVFEFSEEGMWVAFPSS